MEWVWYVIASIGAGVGTGLAGLSAATVMVPMLIVLCPSFSGETGAYQATAIALASDILGSAVATATYAKHKNIDLKRGWLIMSCILTMCIAGSYVTFLVGNVVLGGFTLILTFCIGIRFLVKPDTSRKNPVEKGAKLGWKGVLLSVVCGIPIGFGTGFVGTGGGMMMLIVFTAFFGMELKTSVGTSTFIMTFTALIAVAWGIFGKSELAATAILMWGAGDAAAALIGIPFGKHKIQCKLTDGKKSWEGSIAMVITSFAVGVFVLMLTQGAYLPRVLLSAGVGALIGAATELFSPSEYDTVTVPVMILAVLLILQGI